MRESEGSKAMLVAIRFDSQVPVKKPGNRTRDNDSTIPPDEMRREGKEKRREEKEKESPLAPQGDGVVIYRMLSNPRVPKIMLEGGLCRESERPIAVQSLGLSRNTVTTDI